MKLVAKLVVNLLVDFVVDFVVDCCFRLVDFVFTGWWIFVFFLKQMVFENRRRLAQLHVAWLAQLVGSNLELQFLSSGYAP